MTDLPQMNADDPFLALPRMIRDIRFRISAGICVGSAFIRAFKAFPPLVAVAFLITGCAVGPDYRRPETPVPQAFKEASGDWLVAKPADDVPKGKWWEVFNDPLLNALEEQVSVSNQELRAAEARYRQAR